MRGTPADSAQPSNDPPGFVEPVAAARPAAAASRPAPAGAGRGSALPGTSPSRPPVDGSMGAHSPTPGTPGMLRQTPPEAHVRWVWVMNLRPPLWLVGALPPVRGFARVR